MNVYTWNHKSIKITQVTSKNINMYFCFIQTINTPNLFINSFTVADIDVTTERPTHAW